MENTLTSSETSLASDIHHQEAATEAPFRVKTVAVCDTQPLICEGVRMLLIGIPDLHFLESVNSLSQASEILRTKSPAVLILDKAFGLPILLEWLTEHQHTSREVMGENSGETSIIAWGTSFAEADACRLLRAGAKCVLKKTVGARELAECLRAVSTGQPWFGDCFQTPQSRISNLTRRENQVVDLLVRNYSNKQIAREMGIGIGTVKIHMKNIFHKTGIHSRFGVALTRRQTGDPGRASIL